jgi:hypothetical protein
MLLTSTRNLAEWEMFCFEEIGAQTMGHGAHFSIRGKDNGPWSPLFDPWQRRTHWTGVTEVLALQISNETAPPVKT